ncbi:MAG: rRNA maturation RNase YbeY [Candidatus Vogelbacteria bacterium]|nr:rRNA maturation RNase YbeY [Candidatus Vogelbacteria bacterium]
MLSVSNKTRQSLPGLPLLAIADKVLGKSYDLSLVFVGHRRSRRLNNTYRGKDKPTNVLSFPYDKKSGELIIDLAKVKSECQKFDSTFTYHLGFLFIHGVLHLKGLDHGSTMEREERKLTKAFLDGTNNRNRTGHRNIINSRRRMRIQTRQ